MKNQLFILLFFVSKIVLSQTFELPSEELIKKFKIKSINSFLCKNSLCDTAEIFLQWEFDKFGNIVLEMLGDETDTSYLELYFYDSNQKLITKKKLGDFICHKELKSIDTTLINYYYNEDGYLKSEIIKGGCCDIEIIYEYINNLLVKKTYNNSGCRYYGYIGEILLSYNQNGLIEIEKNNLYNSHRKYTYNEQGKMDSILVRTDQNNKIYAFEIFRYENNLIVEEIKYGHDFENNSPKEKGISNKYYYDENNLLTEISEEKDNKVISRLIYKYEYY